MCVSRPAVDVVNKCIDDVTQHKCPGSAQPVLHLPEQQADKKVVHHQYAVPLVGVGGLSSLLTDCYENPLNGHLEQTEQTQTYTVAQGKYEYASLSGRLTGVLDRMATRDLWLALWHLLR